MANRNARRAAPAAKTTSSPGRRFSTASTSTTFDLSNDNDNYSGVDDISDDEDDEDDVFAVEEQAIMGEPSPSPPSTPRPHARSLDEWNNDRVNGDDSYEDYDEESGSIAANDNTDHGAWHGIDSDVADLPTKEFLDYHSELAPRRVRFTVPADDSSSDSTEDDHTEMYPDIFVDQSTLDPSFRRKIENEHDESSASDSFWDHTALYSDYIENDSEVDEEARGQLSNNDGAPLAEAFASDMPEGPPTPLDESDESNDLDGYETDGETTEEEEIPDAPIRSRTRRPSASESDVSGSETERPARARRDQPRLGRFDLDKSDKKPIAVVNTKTGKMMIFTPDRRRHLDLSPEQFRADTFGTEQWALGDQLSPLLDGAAGLMLGSMDPSRFLQDTSFGQLDDMFAVQTAEESSASMDEDSVPRDSDLDPETTLQVSDFLDLDGNNSSNDEDEGAKNWGPASTPLRPTTASSDVDVLSHLNPATVGAFRRNQVNSQLMIRNQATQDSLDFSGPYNSTAIRGLRSDRFDTAGVPLTPVRRHKKQLSDVARSPLDAVSMKRKASGEASNGGHKKQKSISDVGSLHI